MVVLHLLKTSTGASWALRQMRELVALGIDVTAAMPGGGPLVDRYRAAGVDVRLFDPSLSFRSPAAFVGRLRDLRRLVDDVRPDLIHSHFVTTTLAARFALGRFSRIPRLFQVPGPLHLESAVTRTIDLITAGPLDGWIGGSRHTVELYRRYGVEDRRLSQAYYGTDVDEFRTERTGVLRSELHVGEDVAIVGMVALMYRPKRYLWHRRGIKGHEDLITAVSKFVRRSRSLVVAFVGGPWVGAESYERRIRGLAAASGDSRLRFLGMRPDVPVLYPDMNVAIHPSLSENVGGSLESLLCGVPTVATCVGGIPELVVDGETGWLVPPRSPAELARAIEEALDDEAAATRRASRGRELARERFDVRRTAADVAEIYRLALAGDSASPRAGTIEAGTP